MKYLVPLFLLIVGITQAQNRSSDMISIEGVVFDGHGLPIKKATLFKDSVKTFVKTNKKGIFKTKISNDTKVLSVYSSEHGMATIFYSGENHVEFKFPKEKYILTDRNLEDLGFVTTAPRKGTIDPSKFKDYTDIYQLIREMFTGVEVNGSNIVVRGVGSFGDTTPLFLVDDSYVQNISFINPVEVKSIQLLKGGDATMYGSRGANGVFLIYLKKKLGQ